MGLWDSFKEDLTGKCRFFGKDDKCKCNGYACKTKGDDYSRCGPWKDAVQGPVPGVKEANTNPPEVLPGPFDVTDEKIIGTSREVRAMSRAADRYVRLHNDVVEALWKRVYEVYPELKDYVLNFDHVNNRLTVTRRKRADER